MPTRTRTTGVIRSTDPAILQRLKDAFHDGTGLFTSIIPPPPEFPALPDDYKRQWRLVHWSSLHDVVAHPDGGSRIRFIAPEALAFEIVTVWNMPDAFFNRLVEMGCEVVAETDTETNGVEIFHDFYVNGRYSSLLVDEKPSGDHPEVTDDAVKQEEKT